MASTYDQIACTRLYVVCLVCLVGKAFIFHASTFESYWKWRSKAKGNVHNFSSIQQYLMIGEKSWVGFLLEQFLRQIKRDQSYFVPTLTAVRTEWKVRHKIGRSGRSRRSERFGTSERSRFQKVWEVWKSGWSGRFRRSNTSMRSERSWRSSMSGRSWRQDRGGTKCLKVEVC